MPATNSFKKAFSEYQQRIQIAIHEKKSHDYRRHLFVDFLSKGFTNIDISDIEIEIGITGARVRGFIDALFRDLVFEFKRDLKKERAQAIIEITKYLESETTPQMSFGLLTDGAVFEVMTIRHGHLDTIEKIDVLSLSTDESYLWFDSYLFSGRRITPTSDDIVRRFGPLSPVYLASIEILKAAYDGAKTNESVVVKRDEWTELLAKAYGESVGTDDLLIVHTYLSLFAKVLAFETLFKNPPTMDTDLLGIVTGEVFERRGFENVSEIDFFTWILTSESALLELLRGFRRHIEVYDLKKINEDLLKELYQKIVDQETRHGLGEYYTPDWLAELTLRKVGFGPGKSLLDPACGSGTFLFTSIRMLKDTLNGHALVDFASQNIYGVDINPLAVTIAKVNYVLALGTDLNGYTKKLRIPVFLANSLMHSDLPIPSIEVDVVGKTEDRFFLPAVSGTTQEAIDEVINMSVEFAKSSPDENSAVDGFTKYLVEKGITENQHLWRKNMKLIKNLVDSNRDTIWAFILKNAYRPLLLAEDKFDIVAGNPPWLSYKYIKNKNYQKQIKALVWKYGLLKKSDVKLFTHIDTSTVFYAFSLDTYVKPLGSIAFVMPSSILTGAKQHALFARTYVNAADLIMNLDAVTVSEKGQNSSLFGVPSCVVIAHKDGHSG